MDGRMMDGRNTVSPTVSRTASLTTPPSLCLQFHLLARLVAQLPQHWSQLPDSLAEAVLRAQLVLVGAGGPGAAAAPMLSAADFIALTDPAAAWVQPWLTSARNVRVAARAMVSEPAAAAFVPLMAHACLHAPAAAEGDADNMHDMDAAAHEAVSLVVLRRMKTLAAVALLRAVLCRAPLRALLPPEVRFCRYRFCATVFAS
jgi:hypothetical protein